MHGRRKMSLEYLEQERKQIFEMMKKEFKNE